MSAFRASAASLALAAALAAVAFGARGGTELGRTTTVELVVVIVCGLAIALAVLRLPRGPLPGGPALVAFAALFALTAVSMTWSVAPDLSLEETCRTLAYLAIFAAGLALARMAPGGTSTVLSGVAIAATAVVAYGLATRVWPSSFTDVSLGGRIGAPFDYWNALGAVAALGVAPALWLGACRSGSRTAAILAYPALGLMVLTLLLTQSRGALAAAVVVTAIWLAFVPLRLRTLPVLVAGIVGAAPVAAWALSKDAFTTRTSPAAREAVAGDFGLVLLLMVLLLVLAGVAVHTVAARRTPSLRLRRRVGVAGVVVACLLPLAALTSVAVSDRGLGNAFSDGVDDVSGRDGAAPPVGAGRLVSASSARGTYWRQARQVFEDNVVKGTGAGAYEVSRLRYRRDTSTSTRAHGFIPQAMADLGVLGVVAGLALLAAWLAAAARATGVWPLRRTGPRPEWTAERSGLCALALSPVAFGLQGMIDWTWFVPGPTAMALVGASFVAGRGPLAVLGEDVAGQDTAVRGRGPLGMLPAGRPSPERIVAALAVLVTAGICAWVIWQPNSADRATTEAYRLLDRGDEAGAVREADRAHERNPYSVQPLYARADALTQAGEGRPALRALEQAVLAHPRDPGTWLRLATFSDARLAQPEDAIRLLDETFRLDPANRGALELRNRALNELGPEKAKRFAQPTPSAGD